jgi:phosphatidylinositol glycan class K
MTYSPIIILVALLFTSALSTSSTHSDNWAVIVSTSRYWFNYRHAANALGFYHTVKQLGIPDSNILLMLADDIPCNGRNPNAGTIFTERDHDLNLYGGDVEVDYRGTEVTVSNFLALMTGRHEVGIPSRKRLNTNPNSNILLYMAGHGGDEFLKFQDAEEVTSQDFRDMFEEMRIKGRYGDMLFIVDTCQAGTLSNAMSIEVTPNIMFIGSSLKDENSYAYQSDIDLGVAVLDRFTRATLEYFKRTTITVRTTLKDLTQIYTPKKLRAHLAVSNFFETKTLADLKLIDFFGGRTGGGSLEMGYDRRESTISWAGVDDNKDDMQPGARYLTSSIGRKKMNNNSEEGGEQPPTDHDQPYNIKVLVLTLLLAVLVSSFQYVDVDLRLHIPTIQFRKATRGLFRKATSGSSVGGGGGKTSKQQQQGKAGSTSNSNTKSKGGKQRKR